jgi:hypothetical protein
MVAQRQATLRAQLGPARLHADMRGKHDRMEKAIAGAGAPDGAAWREEILEAVELSASLDGNELISSLNNAIKAVTLAPRAAGV